MAVLVGDLLHSWFFRELIDLPKTGLVLRARLLDAFLGAASRMCEGEIIEEQLKSQNSKASFEIYTHLSEAKAAELSAICCAVDSTCPSSMLPVQGDRDEKAGQLIVAEEHSVLGGLGGAVSGFLFREGMNRKHRSNNYWR